MRSYLLLCCLILSILVNAQVNIRVQTIPAITPQNAKLFIAGNFNQWNPCDSNYQLRKVGKEYQIILPNRKGKLEFKFTRGSWLNAEANNSGEAIPNRVHNFSLPQEINCHIQAWTKEKVSTALPNVSIISKQFYMPQLNRSRRISIYLPNNYQTASTQRYPVLYMQDGQNLFDDSLAFSGEWGIDETLSKLEKMGEEPCIVVAIDNGGANRLNEYSPFVNKQYGGGEGKAYMQFIVETLKPYIDSAYRTHTDQRHTGIAGSSMGGLISLYGAIAYPTIFGKVGVFSPALWFSDSFFAFAKEQIIPEPIFVYYVAGSNESQTMVSYIFQMDSLLKFKGSNYYQSSVNIKADGAHSEWFWKREFEPFYKTTFFDITANSQNQLKDRINRNTKIIPNPASDYTKIFCFGMQQIEVINDKGVSIFTSPTENNNYKLDVSTFANGIYYLMINCGKITIKKELLVERR